MAGGPGIEPGFLEPKSNIQAYYQFLPIPTDTDLLNKIEVLRIALSHQFPSHSLYTVYTEST